MIYRNRKFKLFTIIYGILSVLIPVAVWILVICYIGRADMIHGSYDIEVRQALHKEAAVLPLVVFAGFVIAYLMVYVLMRATYGRMISIANDMKKVLETGEFAPHESYEEGAFGILENAYHRLLHALRQSKDKEKQEKDFLRDVLQDISHQFKTPISSLTVFNELQMSGKLPPEDEQRILEESGRQIQRMDWLVASLLKLARIEADAVKFELEEYPMAATINKAVSGIAHKAEAKQQTIIISCAEDIRVKHDTNWMCEAFTNILNNDIEHTPVGGKIIISVENTNVYTRISIKDNGKGIPEDELKTIFDRFHRGSNNTNPNSVGIGLALTKAIITGQGGSIRADSSLGEYTEFIIFLQK